MKWHTVEVMIKVVPDRTVCVKVDYGIVIEQSQYPGRRMADTKVLGSHWIPSLIPGYHQPTTYPWTG